MNSRPSEAMYYASNAIGLVMFGYDLWYQVNYLLQEYSPLHYVSAPGVVNIVTVDYFGIGFAIFLSLAVVFFMAALLFGRKIIGYKKLRISVFTAGIVLITAFIVFYIWAALTIKIQF
jgi:hypothetical protein